LNVVCTSRVLTSVTRHSPPIVRESFSRMRFCVMVSSLNSARQPRQSAAVELKSQSRKCSGTSFVLFFLRERERCVIHPRRRRRLLLLSSQFSTVTQSLSLSLSTRQNSSGIELFGGCILTCHSTCRRVEEFPVVVPSREKERKKKKRPRDTLPLHTYLIFFILIFSARSGILFFLYKPRNGEI
jgi:hypothetical protein